MLESIFTRAWGAVSGTWDTIDRGISESWHELRRPAEGRVSENSDLERPDDVLTEADLKLPPVSLGPDRQARLVGRIAIGSAALLVAGIVVLSLVEWIEGISGGRVYIAVPLLAVLAVFVSAIVWWIRGEMLTWRQLEIAEVVQQALKVANDASAVRQWLRRLAGTMTGRRRKAVLEFVVETNAEERHGRVKALFEYRIVSSMDDEAAQAVRAASRDILLISVISPSMLAQTAGFTLRAVGMIRGVARAYGHRPGRLGLIPVIRHVFADLAYLSVVDVAVADALPDLISGITDKITKTFVGGVVEDVAEGLVAASRMSRLGMVAIKACRPMPLSKAREKQLSHGVLEMLVEISKQIRNKLNPFYNEKAAVAEAR